jgi:hypothetical protein
MIEAAEDAIQETAGDLIPAVGGESRAIEMGVYLAMDNCPPRETNFDMPHEVLGLFEVRAYRLHLTAK